jgi:uncharacterized membrane protein
MTAGAVFLVTAAFLASAVEMVEAMTIVLAVGVTREWRSTLIGVASALVALGVIVAALGPALMVIPIDALRLVIGTLLLIFGLQWLRKAILRASGYKALHDEDAIYKRELAEARRAQSVVRAGMDWYAYTLSFKGVFLEGLEVVFIVLTFGTSQGDIGLAAWGAGLAILLVGMTGVVVHRPLSRVPENAMKFAVGGLLTTFGIFWGGEGVGIDWPARDGAILVILAVIALVAFGSVAALRRQRSAAARQAMV